MNKERIARKAIQRANRNFIKCKKDSRRLVGQRQ